MPTNTPNNDIDSRTTEVLSSEKVTEAIRRLSEERIINRDQERVSTESLNNPDFALLTNRVINQGSDPESIRRVESGSFKELCEILGLTEEQGIEAIQKAHTLGPAVLEDDSTEEVLWLLTASISADESKKGSLSQRITQFAEAISEIKKMAGSDKNDLIRKASEYKEEILRQIQPIGQTPEGVPIYDKDLGFFAAYRSGIKAAIVQASGYDAVGTTLDTNLAEQGLEVDKQLSPNFGLRFKA